MKWTVKHAAKIAFAGCAAAGVVALSALVASGAAASAVSEGLKTAKKTLEGALAAKDLEPDFVTKEAREIEPSAEPVEAPGPAAEPEASESI